MKDKAAPRRFASTDDALDDFAQIDPVPPQFERSGVDPGDGEKIADHLVESLGFGLDVSPADRAGACRRACRGNRAGSSLIPEWTRAACGNRAKPTPAGCCAPARPRPYFARSPSPAPGTSAQGRLRSVRRAFQARRAPQDPVRRRARRAQYRPRRPIGVCVRSGMKCHWALDSVSVPHPAGSLRANDSRAASRVWASRVSSGGQAAASDSSPSRCRSITAGRRRLV